MKYLLILIIIFKCFILNAQWVQSNGPYGGPIVSFGSQDSTLLVGTFGCGIFKSVNNGNSWQAINNGVPLDPNFFSTIKCFYLKDNIYYAGTYDKGVIRSSNYGSTWEIVNNGITISGLQYPRIKSFCVLDSTIFMSNGALYKSSINTTYWQNCNINIGISNDAQSIAALNSKLYVCTSDSGIYCSTNLAVTWVSLYNGLPSKKTNAILAYENKLYAAIDTFGLFYSEDYGSNWNPCNVGIENVSISSIAIKDSTILITSKYTNKVFKSTNNGLSWILTNFGILDDYINPVVFSKDAFYVGTSGAGVYKCLASDTVWYEVNSGLVNEYITDFAINDNILFGATRFSGIFASVDTGQSWTLKNNGINELGTKRITELVSFKNKVFAGTDVFGMIMSTNNGDEWVNINSGINSKYYVTALDANDTLVACATYYGGPYFSTTGQAWNARHNGLTDVFDYPLHVISLKFHKNKIFAGTEYYGLFVSTNNGISWEHVNDFSEPFYVESIVSKDSCVYFIADSIAYYSSDDGINWNVLGGIQNSKFLKLFTVDSLLFASTTTGFYYTYDNGFSWVADFNGLDFFDFFINALCKFNGKLFIGNKRGIYKKNNYDNHLDFTSLNNEIIYFPNPCRDKLIIMTNECLKSTKLIAYDMSGKIVLILSFNKSTEVNVEHLKKGVYLFKFISGNRNVVKKIIIN